MENSTAIIIIVAVVVVVIAINSGASININTGGVTLEQLRQQEFLPDQTPPTSLCTSFTQNYANYFLMKQVQCQAQGGTWICESGRVGCYTISNWEYIDGCTTNAQVQALKAGCSMMGAKWTCTATQLSCER